MVIKFAIKDFIVDRQCKNLSKNTIESYELILSMFHEFCVLNNLVNSEDISANTVKSFLLYLQNEKGNNPTSRNTKLRTLKTFFIYVEEVEVYNPKSNPTKKMTFAKEKIEIQPLHDYHISQLLSYLRRSMQKERSIYAYRDYMICVPLLGFGTRLGEMINLN